MSHPQAVTRPPPQLRPVPRGPQPHPGPPAPREPGCFPRGHTTRQLPPAHTPRRPGAPPPRRSRGARGRCAGVPVSPPPRPTPGAPAPRSGRAGSAASADPGKRPAEEEEPGAPSGWSREPESGGGGFPGPGSVGATMAFGKSHRDPYATSVGHLIGKERGRETPRQAWGTRGSPSRLTPFSASSKFEKILPLPLQLSQGTRIPPTQSLAPLRHFFMADTPPPPDPLLKICLPFWCFLGRGTEQVKHARASGVECSGLCEEKGPTSEPEESCRSSSLLPGGPSVALSVLQGRERRVQGGCREVA